MTAPSLLDERVEVLPLVIADLESRIAGGAKQYGEPLTTHNGRDTLWDAYEEALDLCLYLRQTIEERRSHHAEIADMAKRMETAERDAAELRMCKGEYAMPDGTIAKCHVNVGVNVWHGERWLAFHECSPDQLRLIIDDAAQEGKG